MAPVAVAAARYRRVVGDVARGLLEVGREPRPLEDLREDVRDPLARDVRAAELRYRVVAVAEEDPLVELRRPLALALVGSARRDVVGELVEVEAAERALIARIAGEKRPFDGFGQAHEREDGPVEVREMGGEARLLLLAERLNRILHGGRAV